MSNESKMVDQPTPIKSADGDDAAHRNAPQLHSPVAEASAPSRASAAIDDAQPLQTLPSAPVDLPDEWRRLIIQDDGEPGYLFQKYMTAPKALKLVIRSICDWLYTHPEPSLKDWYELGQYYKQVKDDLAINGEVFGPSAESLIENLFFWYSTTVQKALRIADAFTPEEIETMSDNYLSNGRRITIKHCRWLALLERTDERKAMLNEMIAKSYTPNELYDRIRIVRRK